MSKFFRQRPLGIVMISSIYLLLAALLGIVFIAALINLLLNPNKQTQDVRDWLVVFVIICLIIVFAAHGIGIWQLKRQYWKSVVIIHVISTLGTFISGLQHGINSSVAISLILNMLMIMYLLKPQIRALFPR